MRAALISSLLCLCAGSALLAQVEKESPTSHKPRSGYEFLTPDLQALQDDDFANPGLLWIERGATLWTDRQVASGKACADCHGGAENSMRGVAARYPRHDKGAGRVIGLEEKINRCRTKAQREPAWRFESAELLAITALLARQSDGMPLQVEVSGPAAESYARGREFFYAGRGQLDLACSNCHQDHVGARLRGDVVSEGQVNGFPVYRQLWQTLASARRMFVWCNEAVRAEPYPLDAQEYVDLELFLKARGAGLPMEVPAVRK